MPRADQPSTPAEDIDARARWAGPVLGSGVLTPDLASFCQSGISVVLASRDRAGRPIAGRGLGCRVDAAGRVRVLVRRTAAQPILQALGDGAGLAVTFTKPTSHRSIQLKARSALVVPPGPSDAALVEAQAAVFRAELIEVQYSAPFSTIYTTFDRHDMAAIEFQPEAAFVQTPGPSAGSALTA